MKKIYVLFLMTIGIMSMNAETFVKVTDASKLKDGDKIVLACASKSHVSGDFGDTKKFITAVSAEFADDKATLSNPTVITLKAHGNFWNLYIGTHAIGHKSGDNDLDTKYRYTTDYAISFDNKGKASVVSQTPGKNQAQVSFCHHNTMDRFALYAANASQTAIEMYKLDESSIPDVEVESVTFDKEKTSIRVGETVTLIATVSPDNAVDKTIVWGSTDATIASVNAGVVSANAVGTAKIWVKATAVEGVSDTCVVTVLPKQAQGDATYNAVTSTEYLPEGALVFIGTIKDGENYVMGQYESGNNIKGTAATYGEGHHSVTAPLQVAYTVHIQNGKYLFEDHDGNYLRTLSSSKLGSGENDQYAKWAVGSFDTDEGTVVITASSGKGIYNNFQGTNDLFNIYDGVGDGSYLAKTVLFSDKAPEWVEKEKDPWMKAASTYIDWGKQEPDEYTQDWGDTRYIELTMNDLPANIDVELTNDGNGTFNCYTTTISSKKTSEKILISWEASQVGVYNGELTLTCSDLTPIVIQLHAEAVAKGEGGETTEQPELTVSADHIYLNPNYDNGSSDEFTLTFSASHLIKDLNLKWERDVTAPWFPYNSEYMQLWRVVDNDYVQESENNKINLGTDDITDGELYIYVYAYNPGQKYTTQLHFTSLKENSKTEMAIDKIIPITIQVSEDPKPDPTGVEEVQSDNVQGTKVLRNGQLYIMYNGTMYDVMGRMME